MTGAWDTRVTDELIRRLTETSDSFYIYDGAEIRSAAEELQKAFPGIGILYSIKANPDRRILRLLFGMGIMADAASPGEVDLALECGLTPEQIYFSAPGKTRQDIVNVIGRCILIADSLSELHRIDRIAEESGLTLPIGIRINPDFTMNTEHGGFSKFGIDEAQVLAEMPALKALKGIEICGIHVHVKSQELDMARLEKYHANVSALVLRMEAALGRKLQFVNAGSGMGIPYDPALQPEADPFRVGAALGRREGWLIESGRYLVGRAGFYVTRVVDTKISCGRKLVILSGTMNGFIRPALAHSMAGATGQIPDAEPLLSGVRPSEFRVVKSGGREHEAQKQEMVTLAGRLCTAQDIIAEDILLPALEEGDLLVMNCAGSYAKTLTPWEFASLGEPAEYFYAPDGEIM